MKRALLIAACGLLFAGMQAQTAKWSKSVENAVTLGDDMNGQAPTAVDNAGNVYVTGSFTQAFSFGNTNLDPIATSAYLGKYDANGNALWAVALKGAATITAITTDEQNNVYIAGTLADAVEVGSTDNNVKTINGKEGEVENQVSSFILAYDANGVLKANKVIWPETDAKVAAAVEPTEGNPLYMDFPSCQIKKIEACNGKLYASVSYTGDLTFDQVAWKGMYVNVYDFMYQDLQSLAIFSINATDLTQAESIANITVTEQLQSNQMEPEDLGFTVDNEDVYLCFLGNGNLTARIGGESKDYQFDYDGNTGIIAHSYVVASLKDGVVNAHVFERTPHDNISSFDVIGSMQADENSLYIGGTFQKTFPFDETKSATDACDLYAIALDKTTFEPQWSALSGLAEGNGDAEHFYENFSAMTLNDGTASVYGYVLSSQNNEQSMTSTFVYNFSDGVATSSEAPFVTGADLNGTTMAVLSANTTQMASTVNVYDTTESGAGISAVTTLATQRVGNTFYFAEPADITVYDLQGRTLMQEKDTTALSIDGLSDGLYILSDGASSMKVLKESF